MALIVAIDGPAGSGKSTAARTLARAMGFLYVDTGAIYRAVALKAKQSGIDPTDPIALAALVKSVRIEMQDGKPEQQILLDGVNITKQIRTETISKMASKISRYPEVRGGLLELQRKLGLASDRGAVLEGRDIGTVVFPDANLKFFLSASSEERAKRRFLELQRGGENAAYSDVLTELTKRDRRDQEREVAPLVAAEDAIMIDTTGLSLEEVIAKIRQHIDQYREQK